MIYPELRDIQSLDLVPPELPPDPSDCSIKREPCSECKWMEQHSASDSHAERQRRRQWN